MSTNSFHNAGFRNLLLFRLTIVLAYQITGIVAGWHIYNLTHDPLALGLIGLAEVIPYFSSALFAGHAVDHYSRKLFGVAAAIMVALSALILMAVAAGYLPGPSPIWIYGAIAANGLARSFISPTYGAMFALVLDRRDFARGSGLSTTFFQIGLMSGPAIGGLIVGSAGMPTAYAIAAILSLVAGLALLIIRVKEPEPAPPQPIFSSIRSGISFVFSNNIILGAQSLDMFAVLFGGAVAMLPAFIRDIYHYGPEGLGILRAAPAIGAAITSLYLARFPIGTHAGRWLLGAVAGFGLCMIGFALTTSIWTAGLFLLFSGIFDGVSVVMRSTIMQLLTPDNMRGRVSAINGIFIGSSNELGAFESGVAARLMGLVPSVIFGGLMTLGVVGIISRLAPNLRRLNLRDLY